jgi:acetyltransferase-like isoleucine patch superfamily enzyme
MAMKKLRTLLVLIPVLLPSSFKRLWYRNILKWSIGRNVRIGFSFIDAANVTIADNVRIGHLNVLRGLKTLSIGENTWMSNANQFFGVYPAPEFQSALHIGKNCYIMSRHYIDLSGTVIIGDRVTLAGRDTHIWSHSFSIRGGKKAMSLAEVKLGDDAYVGARSTLILSSIPPSAIVGAGSVVTKSFEPESSPLLIAGNPATIRKRFDSEAIGDTSAEQPR